MGLFSKSKNADVPATERAAPCPDSKKIRLKQTLSKETISAMASDTLHAGGWVEAPPAEPKIGDKMPDGTVLAGISPDTNKPMYATPTDASLTMKFKEAQEYAAKLDAHGHQDWRVPTKAELNVLFNNRAAIGGFNVTGSDPASWYCSASPGSEWDAWDQRFSDGYQNNNYKGSHSAVRCVR
jgi:hypothetical protein